MRPWFQAFARREPDELALLTDCERCMQVNDRDIRQAMGCGYLPLAPSRPSVWKPPTGAAGYPFEAPTYCAGYTTRLPEVHEVEQAHRHWSKNAIAAFCGDDPPTADLLRGILIFDGSTNAFERWRMTPVDEGGGRE